jgi:HAD superfamily hydrolase (TIGR01490 family)
MVHIFDVDQTVIKKTSAEHFLLEALKRRKVFFSQVYKLPFDWIKYKFAMLDTDFIEDAIKCFAGFQKKDIERMSLICFEKRIKKNIYLGAARIIKEAQKKGERVVLATSSLDVIIRPLEKYFGLESSLASRLEFDGDVTTGRLTGSSIYGENKKKAVASWLEGNNIRPFDASFYSDSYTDIPLLEYCGNPVAVNPDRFLAKLAKKRGWKILKFKEMLADEVNGDSNSV